MGAPLPSIEKKQRLFSDLVRALSLTLDFEEGDKLYHAWRVAILGFHIAEKMGHPNPSTLYFAGMLHDIGGFYLDNHLLHYITPENIDPIVHDHPVERARMLRPFTPFKEFIPIIETHHEHYDGSGFPQGLSGPRISQEAGIVLTADLLDIHLRNSPSEQLNSEALNMLGHISGRQVAPEIAQAAAALVRDSETLLQMVFDSGSVQRLLYSISPTPPGLEDVSHIELLTQLLWVFARIIDTKHSYTMGKSIRATWLACRIADRLPEGAVNKWDLIWASLLHDAGEVGIPRHILDKEGELTPFEWVLVKKHTNDTLSLLSSIRDLEYLAYSAASNHENYDGTGYPFGSTAEEIPFIGRIIALTDAYDAMRHDRPHRAAMSHAMALDQIRAHSGTRFDPSLALLAIEVFEEFGEEAMDLQNTRESFMYFFERDVASLSSLLNQTNKEQHRIIMSQQNGVLLFELEAWKTAELTEDLDFITGIDDMAELCGPLGSDELTSWLAQESLGVVPKLRELMYGDTHTRYLFAKSGAPVEAIFRRASNGYNMLFRSAKNKIETFRGLTAFYRNFLSSSEAVVFTDPEGIITDVNRKFLDLYRYKIKDVVGHKVNIIKSGKTPETVYKKMWAAIKDRYVGAWSGEIINQTSDGTDIYVQLTINSIRDASGKHLGYIGHSVDITEKVRAVKALIQRKAELHKKNHELQKLNDLQSDMVAITSHDLKSPLNTILTITGFLKENFDALEGEQTLKFIDQIEQKCETSIKFISSMLDLAKMEMGSFAVELDPVDMVATIRTTLEDFAAQAKTKNIEFTMISDVELLQCNLDLPKMQQVFANIIGNAIKFSPEYGEIRVTLAIEPGGSMLISICDEGNGIPEHERTAVFEKYYQAGQNTKNAKRGFGSGLGLYIAKHIITAHHGEIWAEESRHGGAMFSMRLPILTWGKGALLLDVPISYTRKLQEQLSALAVAQIKVKSPDPARNLIESDSITHLFMGHG